MMGERRSYLKMKTDSVAGSEVLSSDWKEVKNAMHKLADHAMKLGGLGFGTSFLKWVACAAAIYLLILDRTNWKTNILTSLLIPYIFFSLPTWLFGILRGDVGKWIALVAIVIRLFFPQHFREWFELPGALILLVVVAPGLIADTVKGNIIGIAICLAIGCYLLQEHIRASGGFRNSFTKSNGLSNSIGILLLFLYPVWALVVYIL
ncbi:hypothetical protein ACS0TY_003674 [Phlomoides rotata]